MLSVLFILAISGRLRQCLLWRFYVVSFCFLSDLNCAIIKYYIYLHISDFVFFTSQRMDDRIMKNSFKIFFRDLKNIGTNWVALVILGGLVFLPSLYAWLNIGASWDPYGQTDQLPIGIVNEDVGEMIRDESVHAGDEIVDSLKDNDSMQWHFLDQDKAMDQLRKGDLFAVVVIPEDFSKSLGTVLQAHPEKANVEYYVNEKLNAIAPKITEKGASVIVEEVSSTFISTVNGVIFEVFNEIGLE